MSEAAKRKVLIVKKDDGTQRIVELANEAFHRAESNRLKQAGKQGWEFEEKELTKEEEDNFPYLNPDFKTPKEKADLLKEQAAQLSDKDALIEKLLKEQEEYKKQLEEQAKGAKK